MEYLKKLMENQNPTTDTQPMPQNVPVEQTPATPPPLTPHNSLNWLKLLIIGVIILLTISIVSVSSYLLGANKNNASKVVSQITPIPTPTPTINETASWKTYSSNTFSFKYPPLFAYSFSDPKYEGVALSDDKTNYGNYGLYVIVDDKNGAQDRYNTVLQKFNNSDKLAQDIYSEVMPVSISGKTGTVYYSVQNPDPKILPAPGSPSGNRYGAIILDGVLSYEIQYRFDTNSNKTVEKETFLKILSTFQFTN